MNARPFTVFVLVVSIALLVLLVPGGAQPTAAQSQPAVPVAPLLSPVEGPVLSPVKGTAPLPTAPACPPRSAARR